MSKTLDEVEADQAVLVDLHIINAQNRNVASAAFLVVVSRDDCLIVFDRAHPA
jgi:hypothetical protein